MLDGPTPELMRCGWAFVVANDEGVVIAVAAGVAPLWITDIGGAEAWAMLQAALRAYPGQGRHKNDCNSCIDMIKAGMVVATSSTRAPARVYAILIPAMEDVQLDRILWMPAHKSATHVGKFRLSDGQLLTGVDVTCNDAADTHAKQAVEERSVPASAAKA